MIINSVREFMKTCPLLKSNSKINVDYLPNNPVEYTIDAMPSYEPIKKYVGGGSMKQFLFTFASKEYYGPDVLMNIENSGFYEELSRWIKKKSELMELPELTDGRESFYIEVVNSGYIFQAEEDRARYQMQLKLVYYEK